MEETENTTPPVHKGLRASLQAELSIQSQKCIECKLCRKECAFLRKYGTPKYIADSFDPASLQDQIIAFECSLCELCAAVCPVKINPAALFQEMRRDAVEKKVQDLSDYKVLLNYEQRGTSKRYSYYGLPANCDTVLFPGCSLAGTRPERVKSLHTHLQKTIPSLGIVLDCCTKPSHDLGREDHFMAMFNEMKNYLLCHGVKKVLVACPSCYNVFEDYGNEIAVETVYEHLAKSKLPQTPNIPQTVKIHDPCSTRNREAIHTAIRTITTQKSLTIEEMKHSGRKTICCGEGGTVNCVNPEFSKNWSIQRKQEASGTRMITYCAGCVNFLQPFNPTSHVLDLLFEPEATLRRKVKVSKAPFTYLNRIGLKKYFRKNIKAVETRERIFSGGDKTKSGRLNRLSILLALVGLIAVLRMTGLTEHLEQEKLLTLIESFGTLAPFVYILTYTIAPVLFLPGLPLTILGGILFGPFWGVIYAITGSTAGACLAFLVSRYLGREWIEKKIRSPKRQQLDKMVEQHGWKAVAFTRLIPLFPFNLLNYAFGLSKIKFSHYALASFLFMLPTCIAYIVFSSSLLEIIKGNITPRFIIGIILIVGISFIPFIHKLLRTNKKG